jgi:hypothetical protein
MKSQLLKFCAITIAVSSLTMGGCSKSGGSDQGGKPNADKPNLSSAMSPEGKKAAMLAALPKANADTPLDQYIKITSGNQLMFMYYGLSNMPIDYEKIAQAYSREYNSTNDAFKQKDILNALKPRVDSEIAKVKDMRYFIVDYDANLASYDFNSKAFPINNPIGDGSVGYYYDNQRYQYAFTNGDGFKMLQVADEAKARQIESFSKKYQHMKLIIYAFAQDADPSNMAIQAQIVKIKLLDPSGGELVVQ